MTSLHKQPVIIAITWGPWTLVRFHPYDCSDFLQINLNRYSHEKQFLLYTLQIQTAFKYWKVSILVLRTGDGERNILGGLDLSCETWRDLLFSALSLRKYGNIFFVRDFEEIAHLLSWGVAGGISICHMRHLGLFLV